MYKRGGHRVLVNRLGDLIVRPSPIEASLRLIPCSGSLQQHLLTSYLQSIIAVLLAQFAPSKMPSGDMLAVLRLIRSNSYLEVGFENHVSVNAFLVSGTGSKRTWKNRLLDCLRSNMHCLCLKQFYITDLIMRVGQNFDSRYLCQLLKPVFKFQGDKETHLVLDNFQRWKFAIQLSQ